MTGPKPTFQSMNGCAACKHTAESDPSGKSAAAHGKSYWCRPLAKPVDAKDGMTCTSWEFAG
ncbi:MAG TPA: hypothetical protein VF904_10010 [Anaeromyxobacteraceae bacterium]